MRKKPMTLTGLRQRLQALPAWDIDAYARDFQAALRKMWVFNVTSSGQVVQ